VTALQWRLLPGVRPGVRGTWRQRYAVVHLRQGQLDCASGVHALLMALLVVGTASRPAIRLLGLAPDDGLALMWNKARESYFVGADVEVLTELLGMLAGRVSFKVHQGSTSSTLSFAQSRLAGNEAVLLGVGTHRQAGHHWTLAVGVETLASESRSLPLALLCLDSAGEAPELAPCNARLELNMPSRTAACRHYRLSGGALRTVHCSAAISIARKR